MARKRAAKAAASACARLAAIRGVAHGRVRARAVRVMRATVLEADPSSIPMDSAE